MNQLLLPGENMQGGGLRLSAADKYRYGRAGQAHVINDALYVRKGTRHDMRDLSIPPFVQECAAADVDSGGGE